MTYNKGKKPLRYQSLVMSHKYSRGFTLIELLVTIGVAAVVLGFTALSLFGARGGQHLVADAESIQTVLRIAQQNSITQEGQSEWGVCFHNQLNGQYYELFQGTGCPPPGIAAARYNLRSGIVFAVPPMSTDAAVSFMRITGVPAIASTIEVQRQADAALRRVITVQANGAISITP